MQTGTGKTHTMLGHDIWALAAESDAAMSGTMSSRGGNTAASDAAAMSDMIDGVVEDSGNRGLIPRAMQYIFDQVARAEQEDSGVRFKVKVSYLEIYNENIIDLLRDNADEGPVWDDGTTAAKDPSLQVREDRQRGVFVPGATEVDVTDLGQVLEVLWKVSELGRGW
jgi:hypothetical protein